MNNEIILYQGSPLERIAATDIVAVKSQPLMKQDRLYLASDVIVGEYGVTGFVVVDNRPEQRWVSYTDGNFTGVPWDKDFHNLEFMMAGISEDQFRLAHYVDTDKGFKMIRYFVLPSNVRDFFRTDRFLGEPMVDKCCRDGTLPPEVDEEPVNPVYAFHEIERELVDRIISHINPRLEQIGETRFSWEDFGHRVYFSFHPWQVYKPTIEAGEEAVAITIKNFDAVLSRFDEKKKLQKRNLEIIADSPKRALPE